MAGAEETTVVILSPVEWNFTWQSAQTIASGLAERGYKVIFLNPLAKRIPAVREVNRVLARFLDRPALAGYGRQPVPQGVRIVNPISLPDVHIVFERGNDALFIPLLVRRLRRSGNWTVVISYVPFPAPMAVLDAVSPDVVIYACQTNWQADELAKHSRLLEQELFDRADFVLADSPYLCEHAGRHHRDVRWWPAMVDSSFVRSVARNGDQLRTAQSVRCCYYGMVDTRIDTDLLADVSKKCRLRLIGRVRVPLPHMKDGTELLGVVSHLQLPAHLGDVDVFLLPYRVNEFTEGILPAKTFEYFATGKPVVSTFLPSLLPFEKLVYISRTHDEFLANIERAAGEASGLREQRIKLAKEHATERWMDMLSDWILDCLSRQRAPTGGRR